MRDDSVKCGVCGHATPLSPRSTSRGLCADCDELVKTDEPDLDPFPIAYTLSDIGPDGTMWVYAPRKLTVAEALDLSTRIVARIVEYARSEL